MFKTVFLAILVFAIAIVGGAASVWYALNAQEGVGAVTTGVWTTFPDLGTPQADPYSKGRSAREGVLSLGRAEGLTFVASHDSDGVPLQKACTYTIDGVFPPARLWTLYAADPSSHKMTKTSHSRPPALNALQVLRQPDNSVKVSVGPHPSPRNWLPISGTGPMSLVVTLYDSPAASSSGIVEVALPDIVKATCDD